MESSEVPKEEEAAAAEEVTEAPEGEFSLPRWKRKIQLLAEQKDDI